MNVQPIVISEVFSEATRVVRTNARVFFGLAALLVGIPTIFVQATAFAMNGRMLAFADPARNQDPLAMLEQAGPAMLAFLAAMTVYSITYMIAQLALTKATFDALDGREVSLRSAFAVPGRAYLSIFVASSVVWTAVGIGFLFCCIPAFPIAALLLFPPALIVHRGLHGFASIGESGAIARQRFAESILVAFALTGFLVALSIIGQLLLSPFMPGFSEILASGGAARIPQPSFAVQVLSTIVTGVNYMLFTIAFQVLPAVLYAKHVNLGAVPAQAVLAQTFE